ncbi:MAG: integrase/recombinase XerD [Rickettsiales bacterium]|jgi:integrase/recombinase XerD
MKHCDREILNNFLLLLESENGFSKNTITSYKNDLSQLQKFLTHKKIALTKTSEQDLVNFLAFLDQNKITTNTICRKIATFRNFFKFLEIEKMISENPAKNLIIPKKKQKIPKFLSEKEILTLLNSSNNDSSESGVRISCMLEILYASGLRASELVSLPINIIGKINQNNKITLKNYLIIKGKGSKERIVPLSTKSLEILEKYLDLREKMGQSHSKYLFPGIIRASKKEKIITRDVVCTDAHITRQRFHQILKELAGKTNIDPDRVSPHIIRHSFATHLLNNGVDLVILQELLGHSDISTTQIYTHIIESKLQKLIKKHPLNV